jgi:hypothetical protein
MSSICGAGMPPRPDPPREGSLPARQVAALVFESSICLFLSAAKSRQLSLLPPAREVHVIPLSAFPKKRKNLPSLSMRRLRDHGRKRRFINLLRETSRWQENCTRRRGYL